MSDRRPLSRRKLLLAVATTGAAASTGSGAAALMTDSERTKSVVTAGTLEIETIPSWENAGSGSTGTGTQIQLSGNEGQEHVRFQVSGNPSYVWFRTRCKQCKPIEEKLSVRFGLSVDGTVDWFDDFENFVSLREARDRLGDGFRLGEFEPDTQKTLRIEWRTDGDVESETTVEFDFTFHAVQTRHVMNADSVAPPWECDVDCSTTTESVPAISWVGFCGDDGFETDFTPQRSDDERTLLLDTDAYTIPESVETITIKYGQFIDTFDYAEQSEITVGTDDARDTFERVRGNYQGTDLSDKNFCGDDPGRKYEFPDETGDGGWGGGD